MKKVESNFPKARIPFGCWGSSYFPSWQTSPLAEVNIGQFAGEAMARIMSMRGVQKSQLEYLISGSTVPWRWKFWNFCPAASCVAPGLGPTFCAVSSRSTWFRPIPGSHRGSRTVARFPSLAAP